MTTFAHEQPKAGETIVHCGHLADGGLWFKYETPLAFRRPDGSCGMATWLRICDGCYVKHVPDAPVRGDGCWAGDAPIIRAMEVS